RNGTVCHSTSCAAALAKEYTERSLVCAAAYGASAARSGSGYAGGKVAMARSVRMKSKGLVRCVSTSNELFTVRCEVRSWNHARYTPLFSASRLSLKPAGGGSI